MEEVKRDTIPPPVTMRKLHACSPVPQPLIRFTKKTDETTAAALKANVTLSPDAPHALLYTSVVDV